MRSFLTRLLVAAVAIPALVFIFHRGGEWLCLLVTALIVLGMIEAQRLFAKTGASFAIAPSVVLALLTPWLAGRYWAGFTWPVWLILLFVVAAIPVVRVHDIKVAGAGIAAHITSVLWIGVGLGALLGVRDFSDGAGFWWLLLLFANLWIGDTAAYLFGVWLGKTKLSPVVSPMKTIVGAVAQVVASALVGVVFVMANWFTASAALLMAASIVIGVVGQIGDLFESALKRAAGEKDSSTLIPGHGGVLDRFDSAMFAAPSLYALLQVWPR